MIEIEVGGHQYQIAKLNALQQFHVARRLGPALIVARISLEVLRNGMKADMEDLLAMTGPVVEFMAKMSDEDTNYILFTCLSVVQRKQGNAWARLLTPDGKNLMFEDLQLPELLRVGVEVLKDSLGNFLTELGVAPTTQSS